MIAQSYCDETLTKSMEWTIEAVCAIISCRYIFFIVQASFEMLPIKLTGGLFNTSLIFCLFKGSFSVKRSIKADSA